MSSGIGDLPVSVLAGAAGQIVQPLGWTFGGATVPLTAAPAPVWGAAIAFDATGAQHLLVVATSNVAFTVGAPTGLVAGLLYIYTLRNASGGALGVATYNAMFHFAGAFTNPANLNQRSALLYYNGTVLHEVARTAADVLT